ncbi:MAG: ATP-dependent RNA helicase [Gaeavirus sp.]|uniref:ATP-dependent RNA helicase n=1 Tax=Gaeavirus sp. TaxID=2487767 RepID=A0A3G4ZYH7_9VIRU|nr:MAG: ATP-dependent RNA helicase [Gaeavirus sp.]
MNMSNYNNSNNNSNNRGYNNRRGGGNRDNNNHFNSRYKDENHAEKIEALKDKYNKDFDYTAIAVDLLERDDIKCSPEVFEMECESFDDMGGEQGLKEDLLRGIYAYGFENPARIQSLAIPQIVNGREILAQSQSGTGKTGAFVISALQLIDEKMNVPQAIILSPTCELAYQTHVVAKSIGSFMKDLNFSFTVGGADRQTNIKELGGTNSKQSGSSSPVAQVIIATPGRLKDLIAFNQSIFDNIKLLIIDECDELLHGTFKDELRMIIQGLPKKNTNMSILSYPQH